MAIGGAPGSCSCRPFRPGWAWRCCRCSIPPICVQERRAWSLSTWRWPCCPSPARWSCCSRCAARPWPKPGMPNPDPPPARTLDVLGLVVAGLVNSVLAPADAALVLAPGTPAQGGDLAARMAWIAAHAGQWQAGWAFWVVVTTTFAWSYYALARHLAGPRPWRALAVGL